MMAILMVCLGNICRSPMAEGIMRHKIEKYKLSVKVDSAGTSAYHEGEHPDKRSITNGLKHNINISKLVARQFKVNDFDKFDLIYAMDASNYSDILLLSRNEKDKAKIELIMNVARPGSNLSVPDPYFGGEYGFEEVFQLLDEACESIAQQFIEGILA